MNVKKPSEAYVFIENELKYVKHKLLRLNDLVYEYDGDGVYDLRLSLLDKIERLKAYKHSQEFYLEIIIEKEINYLKKLHKFILDIQHKIFMSNIRVAQDFDLLVEKWLLEYRNLHYSNKSDIQRHFYLRGVKK